MQIVKLLLKGYSYAEIANTLFITESTVHSHARCIYGILGVKGKRELTSRLSKDEFDLVCERFEVVQ